MDDHKSTTTALIPVQVGVIGAATIPTVNAREIHTFLAVKQRFTDWITKRIEQYGFQEDRDFTRYCDSSSGNPNPPIDYFVSLDMAKELSMVERTKKGKEARQYFLECERIAVAQQMPSPAVTPGQVALALAHAQVALEQRQAAIEQRLDAIEARRPPQDKLRPGEWLRRYSKPHLGVELMGQLNAACRRREEAERWRPDGYDFAVPYYTPETIAAAYDEVTRQISFIHDPGVVYERRKRP